MMTDAKILKSGLLPAAKGTAYTCPAGYAAIIKSIIVVNIGVVGPRNVKVWVKKSGGASSSIWPFPTPVAVAGRVVDVTPLALAAGDLIEWEDGAGADCDGNIFGVETMAR